jgi:hypothetical protein
VKKRLTGFWHQNAIMTLQRYLFYKVRTISDSTRYPRKYPVAFDPKMNRNLLAGTQQSGYLQKKHNVYSVRPGIDLASLRISTEHRAA